MEKTDARKLKPEVQYELRKQAIRLRKTGMNQRQVAEILGVYPTTVSKWCRAYNKEGSRAIQVQKRGRRVGTCRNLTVEQEKQIQKAIVDKEPGQLKLPFALWTRIAVQQLIKRLYAIDMPIRTVGEYLNRWGYTPQKPLRRAYEQNPKAVAKWLDEQYPAIVKRAKAEHAEIHWGDETGLCNDSQYGRSYSPRGKTPGIRLTAKRERINLISAITNQGKVRFMLYRNAMNARTLINFLKRLINDVEQKVFLILDNLRVHHGKAVNDWLQLHQEHIELFFLPSYSPELNPDEYLNGDLKYGVHSGIPARNKQQLAKKAISHMRMLQKKPKRVAKYFQHPKIAYAA